MCAVAAVVHDNFLLFVDGPQGKLFQMALNGTTVLELPVSSKPQNPVAVDFDPLTRTVYWTDIESRTVRRAALNGSNQETFLQLQPGEQTGESSLRDERFSAGRDNGSVFCG